MTLYTHISMDGLFGRSAVRTPDGVYRPRSWFRTSSPQMIAATGFRVYQPPEPVEPSSNDVDMERNRRIAAGFTYLGVHYQSAETDRENIMGAATAALGAMMAGAQPGNLRWHGGASDFVWIAADNSEHAMDAQTMFDFGQAAMAHKSAHIFAARALKDVSPIPADYADDVHWPS